MSQIQYSVVEVLLQTGGYSYVNEAACGDFLQSHDGQRVQHGQNSAGTAVYPAPGWDSGLCWTQSGVSF